MILDVSKGEGKREGRGNVLQLLLALLPVAVSASNSAFRSLLLFHNY